MAHYHLQVIFAMQWTQVYAKYTFPARPIATSKWKNIKTEKCV